MKSQGSLGVGTGQRLEGWRDQVRFHRVGGGGKVRLLDLEVI